MKSKPLFLLNLLPLSLLFFISLHSSQPPVSPLFNTSTTNGIIGFGMSALGFYTILQSLNIPPTYVVTPNRRDIENQDYMENQPLLHTNNRRTEPLLTAAGAIMFFMGIG